MKEIGEELKARRLELGLALNDISESTKIKFTYLKALEEGDLSSLPADVYIKGFLRAYGDYLGLDGQQFVERFKRYRELESGMKPEPTPQIETSSRRRGRRTVAQSREQSYIPSKNRQRRRKQRQHSQSRSFAFILLTLILLGVIAYTGSFLRTEPSSQTKTPPVESPNNEAVGDPTLPRDTPGDEELPLEETEPEEASQPIVLETAEESRVSKTLHVRNTENLELVLSASDDCWIGAYADGQLLWEKTLTDGQQEVVTARDRLYLIIGYPPALQISIGDQTLPAIEIPDVYRLTIERR